MSPLLTRAFAGSVCVNSTVSAVPELLTGVKSSKSVPPTAPKSAEVPACVRVLPEVELPPALVAAVVGLIAITVELNEQNATELEIIQTRFAPMPITQKSFAAGPLTPV